MGWSALMARGAPCRRLITRHQAKENRFMSRTILVAAGDSNIIYLLQRYAEKSGFEAVQVNPRQDPVAFAQQIQPVLIILEDDPVGDAQREVLKGLNARPETREIPVVIYSCFAADLARPVQGVAAFLLKSVRYDDFLAVLRQAGVYP